MSFYVDVEDASGTRLGDGPIDDVSGMSVSTVLDGAGTVDFVGPAPTLYSRFPVNTTRYVRLKARRGSTVITVGRGLIKGRTDDSEGMTLALDGPDLVGELMHGIVGRTLLSNGSGGPQTAATVLASVLSGSGWTATGTPSKDVYYQFGDETYLAALSKIAEMSGDHWRESTSVSREIEWLPTTASGFDAVASGLRAVDWADPHEVATNDAVCLIDGGLQRVVDLTPRMTRIYPRGAGNAAATLFLNKTTRFSAPGTATVDTDYVSGDYTFHLDNEPDKSYIKHTVNDAAGSVGRAETFRDIAPLGTTATDQTSAANALFDAALVFLRRRLDEQTAYNLTLTKVRMDLKVGTTLHVVCKHFVGADAWMNIDKHLFVLRKDVRYEAQSGEPVVTVQVTE